MKAFVTGGSGFIGGHLIRSLRADGHEVCALARSEKAGDRVRALGARSVTGDLFDPAALREGMRGADVVFHAAAHLGSWGPSPDFWRGNVEGTRAVIAAARLAGTPTLVHVSTEAVLLGRPIVDADESLPLPARPLGDYARTKGVAETLVRDADSRHLRTVAVRPRFVWGPGDTTLLPRLADAARRGAWRWIGGGRHLTSTTHVRNAVHGLRLAAEFGRGGEAYFVTDGRPVVFREFVEDLLDTQGVSGGTRSVPRGAALALARTMEATWRATRRRDEPPLTVTTVKLLGEEVTVSDVKARAELGYREVVTRKEGLVELRALARPLLER